MNVLVIEDEHLIAKRLVALLQRYDPAIRVLAEIPSVKGALTWFNHSGNEKVDLIFMDIHLEDGDSFQVLHTLKLLTPVIFTTAFDEYMVQAFKVNSIDYLLKPVSFEDLAAALDKFKKLKLPGEVKRPRHIDVEALAASLNQQINPRYKDRFMITVGTKIRIIKTEDIAYFYLQDKTVLMVTGDRTTLPVDYSLERLMQAIDPQKFFRVSRQFVVSLDAINVVHNIAPGKLKLDLIPAVNQEVVVSSDRITDFKRWLGKD